MSKKISGLQKLFNKIVRHIHKQGKPALNGSECAYRGDNGTRCAIGSVLPNKLYKKQMEGKSVNGLLEDHPNVLNHFKNVYGITRTDHEISFLKRMQNAHDIDLKYNEMTGFDRKVSVIAHNFGLKIPKP
jgi:hypothetical protein